MATTTQPADDTTALEDARDDFADRVPNAEYIDISESTEMLSMAFDLDDLSEDGQLPMVDRIDIPDGWMFDAVSLHEETREMYLTIRPADD